MKKNYLVFKRFFDIVLSGIFIIILIIPFFIIGMIIKIDSKGPILFKQERIGKKCKTFKILKFRSMIIGAEKGGVYSDNSDLRITKFGKFLRKTSVDELPQIFNIFVGQMSFIGPRPPLTYHPWRIEEYDSRQKRMFDLRPGITGWAQVNGRKTVEWNNRIEMNVWYVEHVSFLLDIKIFFMTIFSVFSNKDNENQGPTAKEEE